MSAVDTAIDVGNLLLTLALVALAGLVMFVLWDEVSARRKARHHRDPE